MERKLMEVLCDSLHYTFDEEACVSTLDLKKTVANLIANGVTVPVRCSYCDPSSQDYNPCWLCKKGGTAHDVEHCHKTNYGDYEPMQPHCHLCGRKL